MSARKGDTWNESEVYKDSWTLREVRRITTGGLYNQTPTYHTNITFSEDGEFLVFASARQGKSAVYRAHVPTGDITQLIDPVDGVGGYGPLHKGNGVVVGNGMGIDGGHMCLAPRSRWLVFVAGRTMRAVQIETLEERTLIEDIGAEWTHGVVSIDPTETHVVVALMCAHPGNTKRSVFPESNQYLSKVCAGDSMKFQGTKVSFWLTIPAGKPIRPPSS